MTTKQKNALEAIERLKKLYPAAACSLRYEGDPFRLLVMARLSAQCTDARVNIVSETLFAKLPDVYAMAAADEEEIQKYIFACGLYKTKARDVKRMSNELIERHHGEVPREMDELLALSGVGRKIANLIRGDLFDLGGVVADTHCIRISGRLGFTKSDNPAVVEKDLDKLIPPKEQTDFCHRLVLFGREVCTARAPLCQNCPLADLCVSPDALKKTKQKQKGTV